MRVARIYEQEGGEIIVTCAAGELHLVPGHLQLLAVAASTFRGAPAAPDTVVKAIAGDLPVQVRWFDSLGALMRAVRQLHPDD